MSVEAEEISQMCSFPWYFCYPVRIVPVGLVELWHFSLTLRLSTAEPRLRNANRKLAWPNCKSQDSSSRFLENLRFLMTWRAAARPASV